MEEITMCFHYGYNLELKKPTCAKGHRASLRCHGSNPTCPGYISYSESQRRRVTKAENRVIVAKRRG